MRSYSGLGGISGCVPPHSVVRRDPFEIDPLGALCDCGLMSELVVSVIKRPLALRQGGEPVSLALSCPLLDSWDCRDVTH